MKIKKTKTISCGLILQIVINAFYAAVFFYLIQKRTLENIKVHQRWKNYQFFLFFVGSRLLCVSRRSMFLFCFVPLMFYALQACFMNFDDVGEYFHIASHTAKPFACFSVHSTFLYVEIFPAVSIQWRFLAKHRTDILKITHKYLGWIQKYWNNQTEIA